MSLPNLLADNKALADERDDLLTKNDQLRALLLRARDTLPLGTASVAKLIDDIHTVLETTRTCNYTDPSRCPVCAVSKAAP